MRFPLSESVAVKIAVSGASGLLGTALVPALEAGGHTVLRLVRREPGDAREVAWDPAAGTIDTDSLAGVEALVNLSGATIGRRWTESRKRTILESRVQTTGLLASASTQIEPHPSVLVSAGGIGIYGDRGDEILTEDSALGESFLAEVAKAQEAAADPAREAGIRVVGFRQGIVLSARGGALRKMSTPFKLGLGGRVGSGRQWWSWVSMDDVAAAYRLALEGDLTGAYNLTSPNPATSAQFTRALGRALRRPTVFPLPAVAVKTLFGEMGEATLLEGQRALPARLLEAGFQFAHADLDDALAAALAA
jgi:hypothetical protein